MAGSEGGGTYGRSFPPAPANGANSFEKSVDLRCVMIGRPFWTLAQVTTRKNPATH